ncbi:flagellar biosynthesis anti-sigma factor FlgM [Sphingomonas abietis]|uniref:Negative regulator of flagellin synthesis n=1 Tax=Sphingomonas abietis TaxID=3012344 RepID=A0ABY7NHJ3_9SPHN|nr:flagellar biosynthesis anti-sigma factor FlgM [Sphingomonas abietis]WBO20959.1 flagellar biosynthesis anti-sigma factor FlgM [Sphingomonas abietis]
MDGIDKAGGATDVSRLRPSSVQTTPAPAAVSTAQPKPDLPSAISDLFSALADATPPVDGKKVQAIRSLIQSGAYPIDSRAIAQKMVALDFPTRGIGADA